MEKERTFKEVEMKVKVADNFMRRLKGLMFISEEIEKPLLLTPCSRVHSCFMKFPIDVLYLDKKDVILEKERLEPWKLGKRVVNAHSVLEGRPGFAERVNVGDKLNFKIEGGWYGEEDI